MKTVSKVLIILLLSSSLFAKEDYSFDIYNVEKYNRTIPALSLAYTPEKKRGFQVVLSYMSTLFNLKKQHPQEYTLNEKYDTLKMSFSFQF